MKNSAVVSLFSVMLIFAGGCLAGPAKTPGEASRVNPSAMLAAHKDWREKVGVTGLKWSKALENKAIAWATELKENNGCRMKHSGPGENLFWASGLKTGTKEGDGAWQWQSQVKEVREQLVVDSWGSEIQWYSYESNGCSAPADQTCGHYTQLVWAGSTEVGCGQAVCPDDSQVWVCNYDPPGNIRGQKPY